MDLVDPVGNAERRFGEGAGLKTFVFSADVSPTLILAIVKKSETCVPLEILTGEPATTKLLWNRLP